MRRRVSHSNTYLLERLDVDDLVNLALLLDVAALVRPYDVQRFHAVYEAARGRKGLGSGDHQWGKPRGQNNVSHLKKALALPLSEDKIQDRIQISVEVLFKPCPQGLDFPFCQTFLAFWCNLLLITKHKSFLAFQSHQLSVLILLDPPVDALHKVIEEDDVAQADAHESGGRVVIHSLF